jgi:hypothetical protein
MSFYVQPRLGANPSNTNPFYITQQETVKKTAFIALKVLTPILLLAVAPFPISIGLGLGSIFILDLLERIECCCYRSGIGRRAQREENTRYVNPSITPHFLPHANVGSTRPNPTTLPSNTRTAFEAYTKPVIPLSSNSNKVVMITPPNDSKNPSYVRTTPSSSLLSVSRTAGRNENQLHTVAGSRTLKKGSTHTTNQKANLSSSSTESITMAGDDNQTNHIAVGSRKSKRKG